MPKQSHRWSRDEISNIPTGKIIAMLAMFGIPVTEDGFLRDVAECHGASDIHERWATRHTITAEGFDEDFPWMAADVLWRRLAPDKTSTEQLDDMMQEGYDLNEARDPRGCLLWLVVWERLKPRFSREMRKVEDADSVFSGMQCLFNWCQDVEMELGNAAVADKAFHGHRIRYCREFCEVFPESHDIVSHMKQAVAESLFVSGKVGEAEKEFQALVEADPGDPWGYIAWGDAHAGFRGGPVNPQRAEELYRKALGIDLQEDGVIKDRIRDLRQVGRHGRSAGRPSAS